VVIDLAFTVAARRERAATVMEALVGGSEKDIPNPAKVAAFSNRGMSLKTRMLRSGISFLVIE